MRAATLALGCAAAFAGAADEPSAAPTVRAPRQESWATRPVEQQLAALRPVLVGKRYLDAFRKRLAVQLFRMSRQMDEPGPWMADAELAVGEFLDDVQVMFVLEFPEGAQLVSRGMMAAWGMDVARLYQRALANLDGAAGELRLKPVGKLPWLSVIDAEDGYAASRVLLHWRWEPLVRQAGGSLIMGMPARDVVVFTASTDPEKLRQLRDTVETVEGHQVHPVSRKLFRWTPGGWREFADDHGPPAAATIQLQEPHQKRQ
ncbi:MAG: hypothetical protein AB1768_05355 [Pseudomonadota bacterium]